MRLEELTDDDLSAWRVHPVTELLKDGLFKLQEAQETLCKESYWAGNPWPEADVKALKRMSSVFEDLFETSSDDLKSMMEHIDELKWDKTD